MESAVTALATGLMTLAGVLVANSKNRAVMEAKIDALTKQVKKHNCLIERTFNLERDMAVALGAHDRAGRSGRGGCQRGHVGGLRGAGSDVARCGCDARDGGADAHQGRARRGIRNR